MQIQCTCGKPLRVRDDLFGKRIKCPQCGERLQVLELEEHVTPEFPASTRLESGGQNDDLPAGRLGRKKYNAAKFWLALGALGLIALVATGAVFALRGSSAAPEPSPPTNQESAANQRPAVRSFRTEKHLEVLCYSPNGKLFATMVNKSPVKINSHTISVWELATEREIAKFSVDDQNVVAELAFSPDSQALAAGGNTIIVVWDIASKAVRYREDFSEGDPRRGVRLIGFSPNSKSVIATIQGTVLEIDLATKVVQRHVMFINGTARAACSPVEPIIAIAQVLQYRPPIATITVYDYGAKKKLQSPEISYFPVTLTYSGDGQSMAISSNAGPVEVFDTKSWKVRAKLEQKRKKDGSFLFYDHIELSPDGTVLVGTPVYNGWPTPDVWPVGSDVVRAIIAQGCSKLAMAPDGKTVALGLADGVKFFDPLTSQEKSP